MRDPGNLDETVSGVRDGDLVDLLARVEAAQKPSEELDALILCALGAPAGSFVRLSPYNGAWCIYVAPEKLWERGSRSGWWRPGGWPVTASLDASLGLVERVLPGWSWSVIHNREKRDRAAELVPPDWPVHGAVYGRGPTPALALLSALLKALLAQAADTSARNVPAREGASNASRAGTRDHSLAPTNAEPSGNGACPKCGGTHAGRYEGACDGPPTPSAPPPHRMMG